MKSKLFLPLLCLSAGEFLAAAPPDAIRMLVTAPLRFEPAPLSSRAQFVARGARYRFEFTPNTAALKSGSMDVRLQFEGANKDARISGFGLERSTTNLYIGNDPAQWRRAIPNYGRLEVNALYPGIDLSYYGNGAKLEYDLTVKAGADLEAIRFHLQGEDASLNGHGDLVSELIQKRPVAYQIAADGSRQPVESRYRKNADGSYGFAISAYDPTRELVIDPVLLVAQYFSGSYQDTAMGIGHDSNGLIYIGGVTNSTDLPLEGSSMQTANGGGPDLFLAVINPKLSADSQVIYSTYIGGTGDESFGGMTVGPQGDVYMTGATGSGNFPLENAPQSAIAGTTGEADAFVLWLDPTQSLKYSTFFGGSNADSGEGIVVDPKGRLWVVGDTQSTDMPNTGGFQGSLIGTQNMFVAGFDPSLSGTATEIYAIYIGGTHWEDAYGIALAPDGTLWIAGGTFSPDIWIQGNPGLYQGTYGGDGDGYFAHIDPTKGADALLYASFFGGDGIDEATSMLLDPSGRIILSGYTLSPNLPVTSSGFQTKYGGNTDAFVAIVDPVKSQLIYSTYLGGDGADAAFDIKEDSNGILYVSGYTESAGLPSTSNALQASYDGSLDGFGLKLDPTKSGAAGVDYFTYLGSGGVQIAYAVDYDASGDMYLAGSTSTGLLGEFGGPERGTLDGNVDAFVMGFAAATAAPASTTSATKSPTTLRHRHFGVLPHR
jgi:Beta-propeller repeat